MLLHKCVGNTHDVPTLVHHCTSISLHYDNPAGEIAAESKRLCIQRFHCRLCIQQFHCSADHSECINACTTQLSKHDDSYCTRLNLCLLPACLLQAPSSPTTAGSNLHNPLSTSSTRSPPTPASWSLHPPAPPPDQSPPPSPTKSPPLSHQPSSTPTPLLPPSPTHNIQALKIPAPDQIQPSSAAASRHRREGRLTDPSP